GAEDAEDLAAVDLEGEVAHGHAVAEAARQAIRLDDRGHRFASVDRSSVTNAGTPAWRRCAGSSMRMRTRTTMLGRSRSLKMKRGVNSVVGDTCSTCPGNGAAPPSTRRLAWVPTVTPPSSPWGMNTSA